MCVCVCVSVSVWTPGALYSMYACVSGYLFPQCDWLCKTGLGEMSSYTYCVQTNGDLASWPWASFSICTGGWEEEMTGESPQGLNSQANPNAASGSSSWPLGQVNWQRGKPLTLSGRLPGKCAPADHVDLLVSAGTGQPTRPFILKPSQPSLWKGASQALLLIIYTEHTWSFCCRLDQKYRESSLQTPASS